MSWLRRLFRFGDHCGQQTEHMRVKALPEVEKAIQGYIAELGRPCNRLRDIYDKMKEIGPPAVDALLAALRSNNAVLTNRVFELLGEMGDSRAVNPLSKASKISEKQFRAMTGDRGPVRTVNLSGMTVDVKISDLFEEYRENAKEALDKIEQAKTQGHGEPRVVAESHSPSKPDTAGKKPKRTGSLCQGVSPEKLDSVRDQLVLELRNLAIVRDDLIEEFWRKGPIDKISGSGATAAAVIAKVQEEARLIRRHVANIQSLDVTIELSQRFDGVIHDGPEDHIFVNMARRFRNGGVDLIPHLILRTGEDSFKSAYMRL